MAREMNNSGLNWLGDIPNDWRMKKLKFSCNMFGRIGFRGYTAEDLVGEGEGAITLSPTNMDGIKMNYEACSYLRWEKYYESPEIMVRNGDVLLVKTASVGKCSFVENLPMESTVNPQILVLKNHKDCAKFIAYVFQTAIGTYYIDTTKGGSTIYTISQEKIGNYKIPFPPLPEQRAIADFLDKKCAEIDGLLADLEAEVKTLAEYKKSIIAETVTRGLNPNAPMKQSGIPWAETIPAHWVSEKFRYKLKVRRVTGQGDKQVLSVYREYGVVPKDSRDDNHNVTSEDTSKYKYVRPNDFVINKMKAWQGSMGVSDHEGIVSPAYFVYGFSDDDYNPRYFHYFMRNANNIPEYRRLSGGIREGQWDLSPYDLGNMPVIVPPKAEQNEIVAFLDEKCAAIEQSTADKQTQIETLKFYKSSLIYEYVTGKKQVI